MRCILLVEDEKQLADNISTLLENEGYGVIYAENGLEAVNILHDIVPDLIISDIIMPYVDGYELFQKVKQDSKTKYIPFLFLTVKCDPASLRWGMNLGVDDYIVKPFASDDLLQAIKTRLDKSYSINARLDEIRNSISKYVPHELRTPLVAILGYLQLVLNEHELMGKNEIIDMVERVFIGAKRLHARIEKFLLLTELEPVDNNFRLNGKTNTLFNNDTVKMIILSHYFINNKKK
jgi:DNA-binding response OmpR family regulator